MFEFIKRVAPPSIKRLILLVIAATWDRVVKEMHVHRLSWNHRQLVLKLRNKNRIKVVFLAIHKSIWKVDPVFQKMFSDSFFDPEILVCPHLGIDSEHMIEEMNQTYQYFLDKGYPVRKSLGEDNVWVRLADIEPDIVFFTNPHNLTMQEYYTDAFLNYLSCYVPYYYMATNHVAERSKELNTTFVNSMWRIYFPHEFIYNQFVKHSTTRGENGLVTGYPATEVLVGIELEGDASCWRAQKKEKKKVIYAPHHTISERNASLSTFLKFGRYIQKIAIDYQDLVQWSFKPHPMLRSKLYQLPDWGRERTDDYYQFWASQTFTQLDEGEYDGLFRQSDAIIHDCSSFIVEYAFTKNPALYLFNMDIHDQSFLNEFGADVMQSYAKAADVSEIIKFLSDIVGGTYSHEGSSTEKFDNYVTRFYGEKIPSTRILEDIRNVLGVQTN